MNTNKKALIVFVVFLYLISFVYAQDYDLWLRLMVKYKLANMPEFLFCWRESKGGIGRTKQKEQLYFAQKARITAIKSGLYPTYYYLFMIWPYMRNLIPPYLREQLKKII